MAASLKLLGRKAGGVDEAADKGVTVKPRAVQSASRPHSFWPLVLIRCRRPETCVRCGSLTSQDLCQACVLLDSLNLGVAKVGLEDRREASVAV